MRDVNNLISKMIDKHDGGINPFVYSAYLKELAAICAEPGSISINCRNENALDEDTEFYVKVSRED